MDPWENFSLLRLTDQLLSLFSSLSPPSSLFPYCPFWVCLAAGESNIYRKPPIYKRHGMVGGREGIAKQGEVAVNIGADGSAWVTRRGTCKAAPRSFLLTASPPAHSLQVTLERSLVPFPKIKKGLISPKSFATISLTSHLNLPCCLVS